MAPVFWKPGGNLTRSHDIALSCQISPQIKRHSAVASAVGTGSGLWHCPEQGQARSFMEVSQSKVAPAWLSQHHFNRVLQRFPPSALSLLLLVLSSPYFSAEVHSYEVYQTFLVEFLSFLKPSFPLCSSHKISLSAIQTRYCISDKT